MMKWVYYYFFVFYRHILRDKQPHLLTTLAISACLTFLVIAGAGLICVEYYSWELPGEIMLAVLLAAIVGVAAYFHYFKIAEEIVSGSYFRTRSSFLKKVLVLLFVVMCISVLFWYPVYIKNRLYSG